MTPARGAGHLAILGTLAIALAGCGAAATPTAAPTAAPTPTPAPTATPLGVADAFLAQLLVARTGVIDMSGRLTFATTDVPISGTVTMAGPDSQSSLTLALPAGSQTNETIRIGTAEWERSNGGPWVANPTPADRSKTLTAFLETLTSLEDLGVAAKDGRQLHHLVAPASVTLAPDAIGLTDPAMKNAAVTMDFWAEEDGTPASWFITISWDQVTGTTTTPATMTMDLDLSGLGKPATVQAPEDAWERFTSTRFGYSMAHPAGWTVTEEKGQDSYLVDGTPYVTVAPQALPGYTLDQLHAELIAANEKNLGDKPETDEPIVLGGQPGRWLTYHFTNADKVRVYLVDAIAMQGDTGWEVYFTEQAGSEAEDTPVFTAMLSTFTFTK